MIDMYFFTFMFVFNIMIAGALIILEYVLGITNNIGEAPTSLKARGF